jgi:hypothetical protein
MALGAIIREYRANFFEDFFRLSKKSRIKCLSLIEGG